MKCPGLPFHTLPFPVCSHIHQATQTCHLPGSEKRWNPVVPPGRSSVHPTGKPVPLSGPPVRPNEPTFLPRPSEESQAVFRSQVPSPSSQNETSHGFGLRCSDVFSLQMSPVGIFIGVGLRQSVLDPEARIPSQGFLSKKLKKPDRASKEHPASWLNLLAKHGESQNSKWGC